eukprot:715890-Pyramimonas_sp.AAC.1
MPRSRKSIATPARSVPAPKCWGQDWRKRKRRRRQVQTYRSNMSYNSKDVYLDMAKQRSSGIYMWPSSKLSKSKDGAVPENDQR